jgi:hypothetical protein
MINFRFHLVSLIAVFLALGLGILVGSSVVQNVIVDNLEREIRSVRHDSNQANAEVSQLNDKIAKYDDFLRLSSEYAVEQRLEDVPVAIVADKGIDAGAVRSTMSMLQKSGATVPGIFWLTNSWGLDTSKQLADLETAVGVTGNVASARASALRLLAQRLAEPTASTRKGSTDPLQKLRDAGFIDYTDGKKDALATFPPRAARVLVLTGTDSVLVRTSMLSDLVNALVAENVPVVAGEVYDDHGGSQPVPQRGETLAPIRGDGTLGALVSTVDDSELLQGQITDVFALEQISGGTVGHYGFGQGATKLFPPRGS